MSRELDFEIHRRLFNKAHLSSPTPSYSSTPEGSRLVWEEVKRRGWWISLHEQEEGFWAYAAGKEDQSTPSISSPDEALCQLALLCLTVEEVFSE
jgi:DNA-binding IclR family transcriptional regulator